MTLHIVGISGSLRAASHNSGLLRAAAAQLPDGVTLSIFDLNPVPLFNEDLEGAEPESVLALRRAVHAADGLLIASPEFNHSLTGVLKNAIDWLSRPTRNSAIDGKRTAIMGAAAGSVGTARAQDALRNILHSTNTPVMERPDLLVGQARQKFDARGDVTDEDTFNKVGLLVASLVAFIRLRNQS